jgi:uncharacterized membrane protein
VKTRTLVVVGGAFVLAMLAVSAWAWPQIPADARIPIHWGPDGRADGYGSKELGLLGMPLVAAAVVGLLAAVPRFEPRRRNLERSSMAYVAIGIAVAGFLFALHVAAVLTALGSEADITAVATIGSGVLFVVIGNYLGKTRSNWFFGIRTPWTLSSDRSWARTHRAGGLLFVLIGLAVVAVTLAVGAQVALWVMLGSLGVGVVALFGYSYVVWRDDPARHDLEVTR